MKKFFQQYKPLAITVIVLLAVVIFYLISYSSWAFFTSGEYKLRGDTYNLNIFGSYSMTDSAGKVHTGTWKPKDPNMFINNGWYVMKDNDTGETYQVRKSTSGGVDYLVPICSICNASYLGEGSFYKTNNSTLSKYNICNDCLYSKNKYIALAHDQSVFNESEHIIDGKCDKCGNEAFYKDDHEEYCKEHLDSLIETAKAVIPHWVDLDEIDVTEFKDGICFQVGTMDMHEQGYSFGIVEEEEGTSVFGKNLLTDSIEESKKDTNSVASILDLGIGKVSIKINEKTAVTLEINTPSGVKHIKLVKDPFKE